MKSLFNKIFLGSLLLATVTTSCSDMENESSADNKVAASFSAGIRSRAANSQWDANDLIGISMINPDKLEIIDSYSNFCYTTNGNGDFTPQQGEKIIYFPQDGSEVTFKSYYPYQSDLKDIASVPLTVADQSNLPAIDFMSSEHVSGSTKADSKVVLRFYHRLSKLIFNLKLEGDEASVLPVDGQLSIMGMKTKANYNLKSESLSVNADSGNDISVPTASDGSREAIVMPREAGEGISFVFTSTDGRVYTAYMDKTLNLEGGYKYTFNILLKKTPIEVSAIIEDWIDAPAVSKEAISVSTPAGESEGVNENNVMYLYSVENGALTNFTYTKNETGGATNYVWNPETPVYWEDIPEVKNTFYASIISSEALNDTQLPDFLIANDTEIERNHGVDLTFKHAATKVIIKLASKGGTFTADELKGATITLPDYVMGGKEENGRFVAGTSKGNINVFMTTGKPEGIAIFDPQTILNGKKLAIVTLNNRQYFVDLDKDFTYKEGEALELTLNMEKTEVTVSAKVIEWKTVTEEMTAITVGTPVSGGENVEDQEVMHVYYGDDTNRTDLTNFTYIKTKNEWIAKTIRYWEELPDKTNFYAYMERTNQGVGLGKDYLIAKTIDITASNGVKFEFNHVAAQVIITLNSKTFTKDELKGVKIILPQYLLYTNNNMIEKGIFNSTNTKTEDLTIKESNDIKSSALIPAQTISANKLIAQIILNGRTYDVKSDKAIQYIAGQSTTLSINMEKTEVTVSAIIQKWQEVIIDLISTPIELATAGTSNTFVSGNALGLYILEPTPVKHTTFIFNDTQWNTETNIYWNDFVANTTSIKVAAVSTQTNDLSKIGAISNSNTFTWNTTNTNQKDIDLLLANATVTFGKSIALDFGHALSKVKIILKAGTGFVSGDLQNATVKLNNIYLSGTASLAKANITSPTISDSQDLSKIEGELTWWGYTIPQNILNQSTQSKDLITVRLGDRDYPGTLTLNDFSPTLSKFDFEAGKEPTITITLNKTGITLSATVRPWEKGPEGGIIIK